MEVKIKSGIIFFHKGYYWNNYLARTQEISNFAINGDSTEIVIKYIGNDVIK